jgi:hypothetical protein
MSSHQMTLYRHYTNWIGGRIKPDGTQNQPPHKSELNLSFKDVQMGIHGNNLKWETFSQASWDTRELRCKVSFAWWSNTSLLPLYKWIHFTLTTTTTKASKSINPMLVNLLKVCRAFKGTGSWIFPQYPHDGVLFWSGVPSAYYYTWDLWWPLVSLGCRVLFSKWVEICDFNQLYMHICTYSLCFVLSFDESSTPLSISLWCLCPLKQ